MFGLYRLKNKYEQVTYQLYEACVEQSRNEVFYVNLKIPDTFEARFDLLVLHLYLVMERLRSEEAGDDISQQLFDVSFKHLEISLREMGVGDVGVLKRMKKMMTGFNGRVYAYKKALQNGENLLDVIDRNIYDNAGEITEDILTKVSNYITTNIAFLDSQTGENITAGKVAFSNDALQ